MARWGMQRSLGMMVALAGCYASHERPEDPPPVVTGTLEKLYSIGAYPEHGYPMALLERPGEGQACLVVAEDASRPGVWLSARGPAWLPGAVGPQPLEPVDELMVPALPGRAELLVVDVDEDGNDEVLIRASRTDEGSMDASSEQLWIADCSGQARSILDMPLQGFPDLTVFDSMTVVHGSGNALAIVATTGTIFSYVVTRQLVARGEPCRDASCLRLLLEDARPLLAIEITARQDADGRLELAHSSSREVGHLAFERFVARRGCDPVDGGYRCSPAVQWGLVQSELATNFMDETGRMIAHIHAPVGSTEVGTVDAWSTPDEHAVHDLPQPMELAWATFAAGTWKLGGVERENALVLEPDESSYRIAKTYRVDRAPDDFLTVIESNARRAGALVANVNRAAGVASIYAFPVP